jgi:hypothetical protein
MTAREQFEQDHGTPESVIEWVMQRNNYYQVWMLARALHLLPSPAQTLLELANKKHGRAVERGDARPRTTPFTLE